MSPVTGAVRVVAVLALLSWRPALCLVSDECEHYYDYYVPQLTHSTRCTGSTGTGCMSLMCDNPGAQREDSCTVWRSGRRCWLTCAQADVNRDDAAALCSDNHARLPVIDSDEAAQSFVDVVDIHAGVLGMLPSVWLDGGLKDGVPSNSDERTDKDNWTYSNGTVIPHKYWADYEPRRGAETCIRWNQMNKKMHAVTCGTSRQVVCECGNENYPLGALTMSQCIVQQRKSTMAQECWHIAKQLVNHAVSGNKWHSTFLDTCQCAWCTDRLGGKKCVDPNQWSTQWWNETTTTTTTTTTTSSSTTTTMPMPTVMMTNSTQQQTMQSHGAITTASMMTGKQTVMPLIPTVPNVSSSTTSTTTMIVIINGSMAQTMTTAAQSADVMTMTPQQVVTGTPEVKQWIPTVANDHINFTNTTTVILGHRANKNEALLAAMCTTCALCMVSTVLCATLLTLNAVKHWRHKQRMRKAILNAGANKPWEGWE